MSARRNYFYKELEFNDTDFDDAFPGQSHIDFGFQATRVAISNDTLDIPIEYSFLRPNIDGKLNDCDGPFVMDNLAEGRLWFKLVEGRVLTPEETVTIRVWAWRGA